MAIALALVAGLFCAVATRYTQWQVWDARRRESRAIARAPKRLTAWVVVYSVHAEEFTRKMKQAEEQLHRLMEQIGVGQN